MYNDLNEHKRSDTIKWIVTLVAFLVLFALVGALFVPVYLNKGESAETLSQESESAETADYTEALSLEMYNSPQIKLMSAGIEPIANTSTTGVKLTATVLPEAISDDLKLVDWSVYWISNQTGNESAKATDYCNVAPTAPGSNVAYVTAHGNFSGSTIGVKATARSGGFEAICSVTFEGVPTSMGFQIKNADGTYSAVTNELTLKSGQTYTFKLTLDNDFHIVGSKYGVYDTPILHKSGTFTGTVSGSNTSIDILRAATPFFTYALQGDILTLTITPSSEWTGRMDGGATWTYVSDIENLHFGLTYCETQANITEQLKFNISLYAESITIDESSVVP